VRTEVIHVRVKPELKDKIQEEARKEQVTPSVIVRKALVKHFTEEAE
jgi:predicted transcriptional regulator